MATRFTEMFGCSYPLQQAGMGGFTTSDLAIAVAEAGGLGMLSGNIGAEALAVQLDTVPAGLPVGVNFLVPFLDPAALEDAASRSPLVECFWGDPDAGIIGTVHAGRARAGWQIGSADEARA
ncbi:MAG: nitronate monooxygenase, partial [Mycobacterium sp.]